MSQRTCIKLHFWSEEADQYELIPLPSLAEFTLLLNQWPLLRMNSVFTINELITR